MRQSMMQTAIKALLRDTGLTKKEVVEVYQGLASGYEVGYHERLLDIERRRCQFLAQMDKAKADLQESFDKGMANLRNDYMKRSLNIEALIAKTVALRNVELKAATDASELQAAYAKYDPEIEQYKVQRNEMVEVYHQRKKDKEREFHNACAKLENDKRTQSLQYKEMQMRLDEERASIRRKEVEQWYVIINKRMAEKGGLQ